MADSKRPTRGGGHRRSEKPKSEYDQKILNIRRVTRVVRGGRRFSFSLLMAIGNRRGKVGLGIGKARDVAGAIDKATYQARKNLLELRLTESGTIPYETAAKFGSSRVVLRPAPGHGVVAGGAARAILALAGVRDVNAKFVSRSKNRLNNARATLAALRQFTTDANP